MLWRLLALLLIVGAALVLWKDPHIIAMGLVLLFRMIGGSTNPHP